MTRSEIWYPDGTVFDVTGMSDAEIMAAMTPEQIERGRRRMEELRELEGSLIDDTGQTAYCSKLLPCPFCKGRPWLQTWRAFEHGWEARVVCGSCHVSTARETESCLATYLPDGRDVTRLLAIERAVARWNRRA